MFGLLAWVENYNQYIVSEWNEQASKSIDEDMSTAVSDIIDAEDNFIEVEKRIVLSNNPLQCMVSTTCHLVASTHTLMIMLCGLLGICLVLNHLVVLVL